MNPDMISTAIVTLSPSVGPVINDTAATGLSPAWAPFSSYSDHTSRFDLDAGQIWGVSTACVVSFVIAVVVLSFIVYRVTDLRSRNRQNSGI